MRIGIVGSGIAGLTSAWLFRRSGNHVTVFESQSSLGMDAHSIDFHVDERQTRADVPPRMFNEALWPNLVRLYRELGVETSPVDPSKTFADFGENALMKFGKSYLSQLVPGLINSDVRRIQKDIERMMTEAPVDVERDPGLTMGEYLDLHQYSHEFISCFLFPALSSTVCTCSYESLKAFPAVTLLRTMMCLVGTNELFRTRFGTRDVVQRLSADLDEIHLNSRVCNVQQSGVLTEVQTASGEKFEFDHVIIGTQANVACRLVREPSPLIRNALQSFHYEDVSIVVHTDEELMPPRMKDWSNFNLISNNSHSAAMCTIWMNRFYAGQQFPTLFQTIMPIVLPREERIVSQTKMQRPVVNQRSLAGIEKLRQVHREPNRRIWFCGSYASPGVPLLESGVVSGLDIAERLGAGWFNPCSV